jgi:hypothetical protein
MVVVSFYPRSRDDELWPGTIEVADDIDGFPKDAALAGDTEAVGAWVKQYPAWQ